MGTYPLIIKQGATFRLEWPLVHPDTGAPMDLTGWIVRGQVRSTVDSATVLHEWLVASGNAAVVGDRVRITVPPAVSAAWAWRTGVYDIEAVSPAGDVVRISEGTVTVSPEVTR